MTQHIFVWHFYVIQIIAALALLLFIGWIVWLAGETHGYEKGWSKGQEDAHEFHIKHPKIKHD